MKIFKEFVLASAPGKCILFGEHSVVYGYPAISMGISLKSKCMIKKVEQNGIQINLKNFNDHYEFTNLKQLINDPSFNHSQIKKGLKLISSKLKKELNNIIIEISSDLLTGSGLGSSASTSVALMAALNDFYDLNLSKRELSKLAYELEKIVHGTPSGIDNTTCTFGNLIYFQNNEFKILNIPRDFNLIITYTGVIHKTAKAINHIKKVKDQYPILTSIILQNIGKITQIAREEIRNENLDGIGTLMNMNQGLLSSLGVSNHVISHINEISLENGAYGSKLTGAGLGGCVVTLGTDLHNLSNILNKKGYKNFLVEVDKEGVKIEECR
ncbi:MAG: mevalonate kinase [Candidatus Lokiarchaeota archaeon]|nr:mevalonate kinase [Candidatus Lokiarchaeota archaeon]